MLDDDIVVAESSVWIDLLENRVTTHTRWLIANFNQPGIALVDLILCEVMRGIANDRIFRQTLNPLSGFQILSTGGTELAVQSALNYQTLRKRGITIRSTIDCLIATFCIREGYSLLHNDRDFDAFEQHLGLKVIIRRQLQCTDVRRKAPPRTARTPPRSSHDRPCSRRLPVPQ